MGKGDRVVAYLPNRPGDAGRASWRARRLGAIWASVSPEFGPRSVIDRFAQIEPKVLLAVDGYEHRGKTIDRRAEVAAIRAALPTVEHVIAPDWPAGDAARVRAGARSTTRSTCCSAAARPACRSRSCTATAASCSSTTRTSGSTWDIQPGDRLLQPTTTAWMMWNALVSALMLRASIVLFDGDAAWPELGRLWEVAEETEATIIGVAARRT